MRPITLLLACLIATLPLLAPFSLAAEQTPSAVAPAALTNVTPLEAPLKSPVDPREYQAFDLANGLRVLLIHSPQSEKAAVSLEVAVGSGSDPEQHLGLAHFLEHMLFLGTAKYPEAGEYQAFISDNGGRHNAFTAYDRTNYFFDVDARQLVPALDRFAQFFIAPLFNPDYVDRERHAVESEYQSKLKDDGRRIYAAMRKAMNPEHPLSRFSVGSLDTLTDQPGSGLLEALQRFYATHYRAERMSLVIQGPQTLSELSALAQHYFSDIQDRATPSNESTASKTPALFAPGQLPAQLLIQTLQDQHQLSLLFPINDPRPDWDRKPLNYIGSILGHEGEGSLLNLLKRRGWAQGLSAGGGYSYDDAASFNISIDLTPAGMTQRDAVVEQVFAQINQLQSAPVERWRFEEEKRISEIAFRYKESGQALYDVLRLAGKLREYPTRDLLRSDYLYRTFDAQTISLYLNQLTVDNVLITLAARELATDQTEARYQVGFQITPLTDAQRSRWQTAKPAADLTLPAANPFVAENLTLLSGDGSPVPQLLQKTDSLRLWHQQDSRFGVPRANFYLTLRSPIANDSALHAMQTQLFVSLVRDALNSYVYPADVAGFKFSLYPHVRGLSLRLSGYSDKQAPLLDAILKQLTQLSPDPQRFQIIHDDAKRALLNREQAKPYEQGFERLQEQLMIPSWTREERLTALEQIDLDSLQQFIPRLLGAGNIELLAHGNLTKDSARELADLVNNRLAATMAPVEVPPANARALESAHTQISLNVDHDDRALIRYYQAAEEGLSQRAAFALINRLISAPFYTELRTERQRGYIVFSTPHPVQERAGLALVVQSPNSTLDLLADDIDQFMRHFTQQIEQLTPMQLETVKQALRVQLQEPDKKLDERSNRYWQEIDRGYLRFDSREQLIGAINAVSLTDLKTAWNNLPSRLLEIRVAR